MAAVARTLLAVRALGLGDLLTAVPALRALARAFPDHHRVLAAPAALAPLARLTGAVDEVRDVDWLHGVGALPGDLAGADVAVNLHGAGPESTRAIAASRPGRLLAFSHGGAPPWPAGRHERERWCVLLAHHGIAADPDDLAVAVPDVRPPAVAQGATVVHPGAASASRRWPSGRWAVVARAEEAAGRPVVVTGGAAERPLAEEVARLAGLPADRVLAGRTSLLELAAVLAAAGRVTSGDTGVAHLAYALGRPTVTLFGPTPPGLWGPPARPHHVALHVAGGDGDPHAGRPDERLLRIAPREVAAALASPTLAAAAAGKETT
ncbi:MAG TPA: glycosyltransferase family 9 protein [Baekduia sp.]|nr:glycosyltransferase family 9 protein [Baekduia sp.]